MRSNHSSPSIALRGLAALLLTGSLLWTARADDASDRAKQIAELEKQLAELRKKLDDLKKGETRAAPKPLTIADIPKWRDIVGVAVAENGEWFAARMNPLEGEGEVVVRNTKSAQEYKFASGEGRDSLSFSRDGKWLSFTVGPRPPGPGSPAPASASTTPPAPPPREGRPCQPRQRREDRIRRDWQRGVLG